MDLALLIADMLGGENARLLREHAKDVTELRLRLERPMQLHLLGGGKKSGNVIDEDAFRRILNRLMNNSMYACERELQQGYFTSEGGCRVGICGKIVAGHDGIDCLGSIGSACIRFPRQVHGCASPIAERMLERGKGLRSVLILSPPGLGKTTLLRDLARQVSECGHSVCIADERREIAACVQGVPQLDVGPCSDVMDGLQKAIAVPMLLRACAPELIVVDELGGEEDVRAVLDAHRCGVRIAATAHAGSMRLAFARPGFAHLLREQVFDLCALLGPEPGKIEAIYDHINERLQYVEGAAFDSDPAGLHCGWQGIVQPEEAQI